MKAEMIILPTEVHDRESLVKQIQARIRMRSPSEAEFNELIDKHGVDRETAREISGWYGPGSGDRSPVEEASAIIRYAGTHEDASDRIKYVAAIETQGSMRRVGEATGAALGSAAGLGLLRLATQHSAKLLFGGTLVAGGLAAVAVGSLVKANLGKVAAAVAVVNVASATALVALSLMRRR